MNSGIATWLRTGDAQALTEEWIAPAKAQPLALDSAAPKTVPPAAKVYTTTRQRGFEKAAQIEELRKAYCAANPKVMAWLESSRSDFAVSLLQRLRTHGHLTVNQLAAVNRCIDQDHNRKVAEQVGAVAIDVSRIVVAFTRAQANQVKRPKMHLADFTFSTAPATGANAGALYVKSHDDQRTYMGKVMDGKFMRSRDCNDEQAAQIVAVASDPLAAAVAYGQRTGECSICGRQLTNHASIDVGIGPICQSKFFGA